VAAYSHLLGHNVTVHYRAGEILVPATGTFVGDSGRSIFLEQHVEQRGKRNYFRWEIPYRCIHRVDEAPVTDAASGEDGRKALAARAGAAAGIGGQASERTEAADAALPPNPPRP